MDRTAELANYPGLVLGIISLLIILLLTVIVLHILRIHFTETVRKIDKIPGPPPTPILGHVHQLTKSEERLQILMQWQRIYGELFRFFAGYRIPLVCLSAPADVQKILGSMEKHRKSSLSKALVPWFGKGLLMATGTAWQHLRRLSAPAFQPKIVNGFFPVFNKHGKTFAKLLETKASETSVIDVCTYSSDCTLKSVFETSFGVPLESLDNSSLVVEATTGSDWDCRLAEAIVIRLCRPWLESDFLWNLTSYGRQEKKHLRIMKDVVGKVISARKTQVQQDQANIVEPCITDTEMCCNQKSEQVERGPSFKPFLDLMIQRQKEGYEILTDEIIRDTTLTVTAAPYGQFNPQGSTKLFVFFPPLTPPPYAQGFDTTANTISLAIFFIASDPEVQRIVHQEMDDIFSVNATRDISLDDVSRMTYLESCINETLRLVPAIPHLLRYIHEDIELDDGKILPAGADAFVFVYALHRNAETFPDPEKFDPSRFFPENTRGRHPYSFVPFSAGPKSCLGHRYAIIEMKIFLAHVFRQFCVTAVDTLEDIGLVPDLVLRPKAGIRVTLKHRSPC